MGQKCVMGFMGLESRGWQATSLSGSPEGGNSFFAHAGCQQNSSSSDWGNKVSIFLEVVNEGTFAKQPLCRADFTHLDMSFSVFSAFSHLGNSFISSSNGTQTLIFNVCKLKRKRLLHFLAHSPLPLSSKPVTLSVLLTESL